MKVICKLEDRAVKNSQVEVKSCGSQFGGCVQIVKDGVSIVVDAYELTAAVYNCIHDYEQPEYTHRRRYTNLDPNLGQPLLRNVINEEND